MKLQILILTALCIEGFDLQTTEEPGCVDDETLQELLAKRKKLYDEASAIAKSFHSAADKIDSNFDLYKFTCNQIKEKMFEFENVTVPPLCSLNDKDEFDLRQDYEFAVSYFDFMCHLKEKEYQGFFDKNKWENTKKSGECSDVIREKTPDGELVNLCSSKMPEVLNCLNASLDGTYQEALVNFLVSMNDCSKGPDDYLKGFMNVGRLFRKYNTLLEKMDSHMTFI